MITMFIAGPILYTTTCTSSNDPKCSFNRITCAIDNYQITSVQCDLDDVINQCHQLVLDCVYDLNNICTAPYKYFNSYQNAENYYNNNFKINQTLTIYFDKNNNCSYYIPFTRPYEQVVGLVFIIFGIFLIVSLLFVLFCQWRTSRRSYIAVTNELPKYTFTNQNPPPYQHINKN